MYKIFEKLFGSDDLGWDFLKKKGFTTPRICNLKRRGFSSFAKEILLLEANKQKIQIQPNDFYKEEVK